MSPSIAFRAVVLPAPLGPMSPRIRPSSTFRFKPSSAVVLPNALRRPRASMHAIGSALLLLLFFFGMAFCAAIQQVFRFETEPLDCRVNSRPFLGKKLLSLALQQQIARPIIDKHAATSSGLHQSLVHQFLIALLYREWIDPILRCDI